MDDHILKVTKRGVNMWSETTVHGTLLFEDTVPSQDRTLQWGPLKEQLSVLFSRGFFLMAQPYRWKKVYLCDGSQGRSWVVGKIKCHEPVSLSEWVNLTPKNEAPVDPWVLLRHRHPSTGEVRLFNNMSVADMINN